MSELDGFTIYPDGPLLLWLRGVAVTQRLPDVKSAILFTLNTTRASEGENVPFAESASVAIIRQAVADNPRVGVNALHYLTAIGAQTVRNSLANLSAKGEIIKTAPCDVAGGTEGRFGVGRPNAVFEITPRGLEVLALKAKARLETEKKTAARLQSLQRESALTADKVHEPVNRTAPKFFSVPKAPASPWDLPDFVEAILKAWHPSDLGEVWAFNDKDADEEAEAHALSVLFEQEEAERYGTTTGDKK